MKKTLREAMGLGQALSHTGQRSSSGKSVVATITVDEMGRYVRIGAKTYDLFHMAEKKLGPSYDPEEDDEGDAISGEANHIEQELLKKHGVTHVIDPESFGDGAKHPVEEYLAGADDASSDAVSVGPRGPSVIDIMKPYLDGRNRG